MMGRTPFPPVGDLPYVLTLPGYGFYWFRLTAHAEVPRWHEERSAPEDLPVLVLFDGWNSFFRERVVPWRIGMAERMRAQLEQEALPRFLAAQRWYAAKGAPIARAALKDHALLATAHGTALLALLNVDSGAHQGVYFAPLVLAWEDGEDERARQLLPATVARVRQQANVGVLADAFADEAFCLATLEAIGERLELPAGAGVIRFEPTTAFEALSGDEPAELPVHPTQTQTSNTTVALGQRFFLKGYRMLRPGINPELELGRFLTEVARFPNAVPLAGAVEYVAADGTRMTLALLQAYVENQGDAWSYTLDYLARFLEERRTGAEPPAVDVHGVYLALMHTLGTRTAELHHALALRTGDPLFDPEAATPADLAAWKRRVRDEVAASLDLLQQRRAQLSEPARALAGAVLERRATLLAAVDAGVPSRVDAVKARYHGDYHLGQVLINRNDFVIADFEGEPGRPLPERRAKHSPLRDVAGMLRSFGYARAAALSRATNERPEHLPQLEPLARQWETEARQTFLRAYREASDGGLLYRSFDQAQGLIALFELEKAFYELRYELGHRPEWAVVPLRGILALAGAVEKG
jgi:maltose alpha-D-glucosyltransferase/alpha-amylase